MFAEQVLQCLLCGHALTPKRQLQSGQWVADCSVCGTVNMLRQHSGLPNTFFVAGMIFDYRRK